MEVKRKVVLGIPKITPLNNPLLLLTSPKKEARRADDESARRERLDQGGDHTQ